jgi:hypothetical protein
MTTRTTFLAAALTTLAILQAGCQSDPTTWHGELKYLNVHAIAFTPNGAGLVMVGSRAGDGNSVNATGYYYLNLTTMSGRRLGYGQYSLGQAIVCPFADRLAVPTYFSGPARGQYQKGYEVYDLATGQIVFRRTIDPLSYATLFLPHSTAPLAAGSHAPPTQPEEAALKVWEKLTAGPLTAQQKDQTLNFHPFWVRRGSRTFNGARIESLDKQTFYAIDSPDVRKRLYIRFNAPSGNATKAADPDDDGFAYGFLADYVPGGPAGGPPATRKLLFSTNSGDETIDGVAGAFASPVWLIKQMFK